MLNPQSNGMQRFRATHIVLGLLCLMYFITYLDRVNVSTAALGFAKDFNFNKTEIGLVFSAFAYPYLIFQIIGGWISDRFGARRTLIVCGCIWAGATVLTGMAGGLTSMLLARILLGFGEGATFPAATTAMSRWVPMGQRGRAQGITHAAARIGNAVAPAAIVAVMAVYGWRKSFYACAAASFLWVALWTLAYREFPKDHPRITALELASLPAFAATPSKVPWRRLLKRMAPVTAVYFCYGWTLWLFLSWIPQYFQHNQSLDLKRSALFASGVFFGGVLGDTLGGEMTIGPMWATPMDIAPGHSGTASGIMNSGSALAAIISPVVAGYVIDRTGNWQLPFVGSMILMGVGVLLAHRMRPDSKFDDGMQ